MKLFFCSRTFSALLLAVLFGTQAAQAGPVSLFLLVDPPTTAGAGIASAGGFALTSTRSGAGTWQLYAVDEATGSFGIAQVNAALTGTIPLVNNRATQTLYDTSPDDTGFKAGLTLLRS